MSGAFIFKTFIEVAAVVLIAVGFIFEERLVAFENKVMRLSVYLIRRHRRRKITALRLQQQRDEQQRCSAQAARRRQLDGRAQSSNKSPAQQRSVKKITKRVA